MNDNRKIFKVAVILVIITVIATFSITSLLFTVLEYRNPPYTISFDRSETDIESILKFRKVKDILKSSFYMKVDTDDLLEGAVAGMAEALKDPYTVYYNKEQMQLFKERTGGSYVGIGVTVRPDENGILTIVEPFEDSPAEKAGIIRGDKIVKVDGEDVTEIPDEDLIISMIKGKEDTMVKIEVYRPSEGVFYSYDIIRKKIKTFNITSKIIMGDIGYINMKMFDSEAYNDFKYNVNKLAAQGMKSLIIDLRDNPGGSYQEVVKITDLLVPEGIIVYTEDRNGKRETENSDKTELNMPIAVLINENSASASEILAGAIKDHKKGVLIGEKTFGKGLVQVVITLDDGSGLKVTVSRYFTPSGVCIQGIGIKPDIEEELNEEYHFTPISQIPEGKDNQLLKAQEVLTRMSR